MAYWLQRHRFLIAFGSLASLMGLGIGLFKVTTSLYALALGANETMLGSIAASQSIGILVMSLPLGLLVERFGPKRLFDAGTWLAAGLFALLPLWPSSGFLLVCTAAIGFCLPFRYVALNTVFLTQLLTLGEQRAGWFRGTNVAGMFLLGPLLAALAIERLGYRGTYFVISASLLLSLPLARRVLGSGQRSAQATLLSAAALRHRLQHAWQDAELRTACCVELGAQSINAYYTYFIVAVAIAGLGASAREAAALVAAQGLSFVLSLFALGGLAARLGLVRSAQLSVLSIVVALLCLGLAQRLWLLQLGGLLLGLGLGFLQVVNLARFARAGARLGQGQAAGMNALAGPLGGFAGSLLGGLAGQHLGLQNMFLSFIPVALLVGHAAGMVVSFNRQASGAYRTLQ